MERGLSTTSAFNARAADRGGRRAAGSTMCAAVAVGGGSVGNRDRRQRGRCAEFRRWWRMAEAAIAGTLDQLSSGGVRDLRRSAAARILITTPIAGYGTSIRPFLDGNPGRFSACLTGCAPARKLAGAGGTSGPGRWKLHEAYRAIEPTKEHLVSAPTARALSVGPPPPIPEGGVTLPVRTTWTERPGNWPRAISDGPDPPVQRENASTVLPRVGCGCSAANGPGAIVQSDLRQDVEAVAGGAGANSRHYRQRWAAWCKPLFDGRPDAWRTIREAITAIENRIDVPLEAGGARTQRCWTA